MKKISVLIFSLFLANFLFAQPALAYSPFYSASFDSGTNALRINVSGASSFSQINFFGRQGGDVWTQITNVGTTDQSGNFNGLVYPGFNFYSGSVESYVVAGGQQSATVTVNPQNNCLYPYTNCSGTLSFSQSNVNLNAGQQTTVSIYQPNFNPTFYIASQPNSSVATATLSGSVLTIYGNNSGNTSVQVCTTGQSQCGTVFITVNGGIITGQITFSSNDIALSVNQSMNIVVYGPPVPLYLCAINQYCPNNSFYISSNSNPSAVTASIAGSNISLMGNSSGGSVIVVCLQNQSTMCGNLRVNVNGFNGGNLVFLNTALPLAFINQSYSASLQVTGGTYPYLFTLWQGALPSGMFLNSNGTITGTPQSSQTVTFTVRATDNFGRSALQNFSLTVSGSVLGDTTYANGSLIKEGNTIFEVYKNTKSGFVNWPAFSNFGFKSENVIDVGASNLADSGHTFATAQSSHPWGSWVKSGSTVYFVHEAGLIPISSYDLFLNNGGQDKLVVLANNFDFQRPLLSFMISSDPRLK